MAAKPNKTGGIRNLINITRPSIKMKNFTLSF